MRLALGSQARVGKDTFADYVCDKYNCKRFAFAEGIYTIASTIQDLLGKSREKDPRLLQMLGTQLKNIYGENVWVERTLAQIDQHIANNPSADIVITDLRFPNEMEALKSRGFTTIRIHRVNRIIDRDPTHISEIALENAEFDYNIFNNGSMDDYYNSIEQVLDRMK